MFSSPALMNHQIFFYFGVNVGHLWPLDLKLSAINLSAKKTDPWHRADSFDPFNHRKWRQVRYSRIHKHTDSHTDSHNGADLTFNLCRFLTDKPANAHTMCTNTLLLFTRSKISPDGGRCPDFLCRRVSPSCFKYTNRHSFTNIPLLRNGSF